MYRKCTSHLGFGLEAGPGDFIFIPAYAPHCGTNPSSDEPSQLVLFRTPDNIIVNLEK